MSKENNLLDIHFNHCEKNLSEGMEKSDGNLCSFSSDKVVDLCSSSATDTCGERMFIDQTS
ncbi:MAG: hypothetical protein ACI4A3_12465 [Lachnospiraceae bacterium]